MVPVTRNAAGSGLGESATGLPGSAAALRSPGTMTIEATGAGICGCSGEGRPIDGPLVGQQVLLLDKMVVIQVELRDPLAGQPHRLAQVLAQILVVHVTDQGFQIP